ncbi:hypothetical protein AGMMS50293_03700 [Spirochaetia bacterium]|nr:hypothetical protein AGMMS50293_03700 [Spirochaetia bacterium]
MGLLSKAAVQHSSEPESRAIAELRAFIEEYQTISGVFQCIIINADAATVNPMVTHFGAAYTLPSGCLVLIPYSMDRELLAHRLSKSLNADILCQCGADSAESALQSLADWL